VCHQILYINNIKWIDQEGYEGYGSIELNPPPFTVNGHEIPEDHYVVIHDKFFTYFHDYFIWIETYNPTGAKEFNRGFNYCGMTAIRGENLAKFGKLIDSLLSLFENAPENIILTGDFCFGGKHKHNGNYEKIRVKKDELFKIFGSLKIMTDRAIKNNGYLLHFGI